MVLLETVRFFSGCLTSFHEGHCPTQHRAVCVNSHTAVYGQSADDMVLLEALRLFPAASDLSRRLLSDTAPCSVCELIYSGIWTVCRRHGVARSASAFSGCLAIFHEGHCPTQHCIPGVNSHTAVYGQSAGDIRPFIHSFSIPEIHQSGYRICH